MLCTKCGTENTDTTKFCVKCGTKVAADEAAAAPAPSESLPTVTGTPTVPAAEQPPGPAKKPGRAGVVVGWILAALGLLGIAGVLMSPPNPLTTNPKMQMAGGLVCGLGFLLGGILLTRRLNKAGVGVLIAGIVLSMLSGVLSAVGR